MTTDELKMILIQIYLLIIPISWYVMLNLIQHLFVSWIKFSVTNSFVLWFNLSDSVIPKIYFNSIKQKNPNISDGGFYYLEQFSLQ